MDTIASVNKTPFRVEKSDRDRNFGNDAADQMKEIRKMRLRRKVLQDPSMAAKLVATENSPTYNARGTLIASVTSMKVDV